MSAPYWIDAHLPARFPPVELALDDPDGLLAIGGDLSEARLISAYQQGIFPWYSEEQPIMWWSPDPRMVLLPQRVRISKSLRKSILKQSFTVTFDSGFSDVIQHCAAMPRRGQDGTWIVDEMQRAYLNLYQSGYAHSVEVWQDQRLVGGLYGVSLGRVFFGESMFSRVSDASKVALVYLCALLEHWQFPLIDCQVYTPHLASLGAEMIPREEFIQQIESCSTEADLHRGNWQWPEALQTELLTKLSGK